MLGEFPEYNNLTKTICTTPYPLNLIRDFLYIPYNPCMANLPTWMVVFLVDVGKYTIHGCYGYHSSISSSIFVSPSSFSKTPVFSDPSVLRGKPLGSRSEGCKHPWVKDGISSEVVRPSKPRSPLGWKCQGILGCMALHGLPKHTKKHRNITLVFQIPCE